MAATDPDHLTKPAVLPANTWGRPERGRFQEGALRPRSRQLRRSSPPGPE